jgi:hypothetical protein
VRGHLVDDDGVAAGGGGGAEDAEEGGGFVGRRGGGGLRDVPEAGGVAAREDCEAREEGEEGGAGVGFCGAGVSLGGEGVVGWVDVRISLYWVAVPWRKESSSTVL